MRTIALIELENNFPQEFSSEILKCLPENVSKVISTHPGNFLMNLTKLSLIIYVVDKIDEVSVNIQNYRKQTK
jgi:hypothetical protein